MTSDEYTRSDLAAALDALVPQSLDDVIRKNRDRAQIYLSTPGELAALAAPGLIVDRQASIKGVLRDWSYVTLKVGRVPGVILMGYNVTAGRSWGTSVVVGKDLVLIGEDISEQLDVEPAKFFVHRHIRPQYACRACEMVSAAPIPPAVIDGGMAATGLLAWVVIGKYLDHLPLYRLEQIAARDRVMLSRSTMAEWVGRIGVALQPLAERLAGLLLERQVLHADETPVAQLDPGNGKTKRAYLWAYRSNVLETGPPIVVFDYQTSRAGAHARNFLSEWRGHLMVDDFGGYKALFQNGVTELGCLAHARRKFFDLNEAQGNPIAQEALARIAALYAIEAQGREMKVGERTTLRQEQARPQLQALHDWLLRTRVTVANGGGTAKAIDYSLKRWAAYSRYATDGRLPIDNNPVENTIRPIAIGKKNWLFAGSERAGKRAAAIQTLLATAKLNGLDPAAWLRDTLEKLPTCRNSQIDSLLPFNTVALHHPAS